MPSQFIKDLKINAKLETSQKQIQSFCLEISLLSTKIQIESVLKNSTNHRAAIGNRCANIKTLLTRKSLIKLNLPLMTYGIKN